MRHIYWIFLFLGILFHAALYGKEAQPGNDSLRVLDASLFATTTCPHCHRAIAFLKQQIPSGLPVRLHIFYIDRDKNALDLLNKKTESLQIHTAPFAVPALFLCNNRWVGFDTDQTSGKVWLHAIQACSHAMHHNNASIKSTMHMLQQEASADFFWQQWGSTSWGTGHSAALGALDILTSAGSFMLVILLALWCWHKPSQLTNRQALWLMLPVFVAKGIYITWLPEYYDYAMYWKTGLIVATIAISHVIISARISQGTASWYTRPYYLQILRMIFVLVFALAMQDTSPSLVLMLSSASVYTQANPWQILLWNGAYWLSYIAVWVLIWLFAMHYRQRWPHWFSELSQVFLLFASIYMLIYTIQSW